MPRRLSRLWLALPFLTLLLLALAPIVNSELRAVSILLGVAQVRLPIVSTLDTNQVTEEVITFGDVETLRARIYHPMRIAHPCPLVVVHGMQFRGMDEPRLRRFARTLAEHGFLVMTPQVDELADYRITRRSAVVIGDAVHELARRSGAHKMGLIGMSFAGGMALIAASDPAVARELSVVAAVGAYDDLRRVLHYYATDEARAPDGSVLHLPANEYGPVVVVYNHPSEFFPPGDVARARLALRCALHEEMSRANQLAGTLSPAGQARMAELRADVTRSLAPEIEHIVNQDQAELRAASPRFSMAGLRVPVMLLHGAADNVVPPTETLWLERDLPPGVLRGALITPVVGHVEMEGASWRDRWRLIEWMRHMLALLESSGGERG